MASAALVLTALSFAAGVAGDLTGQKSVANSGARVVLRIPPASAITTSPATAAEPAPQPTQDDDSA